MKVPGIASIARNIASLVLFIAVILLVVNNVVVRALGAVPPVPACVVYSVEINKLVQIGGLLPLLMSLLWFVVFLMALLGLTLRGWLRPSKIVPISEDMKPSRIATRASGWAFVWLLGLYGNLTTLDAPTPAPNNVLFFVRLGRFIADYSYVLIPLLWLVTYVVAWLALTIQRWLECSRIAPITEDWPADP